MIQQHIKLFYDFPWSKKKIPISHGSHDFLDFVDSLLMNYKATIKVNKYKSWT